MTEEEQTLWREAALVELHDQQGWPIARCAAHLNMTFNDAHRLYDKIKKPSKRPAWIAKREMMQRQVKTMRQQQWEARRVTELRVARECREKHFGNSRAGIAAATAAGVRRRVIVEVFKLGRGQKQALQANRGRASRARPEKGGSQVANQGVGL